MHRFLLTKIEGDIALLPPEEARHALKVLRLSVGDEVAVSDGRGLSWIGRVEWLDAREARVRLAGELASGESPATITLYKGLPKADKLELIVQKAVELGVHRLVPVVMARSVSRPDAREAERKAERLRRIALEACKQCGRARVPEIAPAIGFAEALGDMARRELMLMPWEEARGARMRDAFAERPDARDLGLLIGPEGGIERAEAERVLAAGGIAITLGPRILRCETAAIACVALLQQLWGDI
ncbi:16S rRNA (uracil(1498)-N(3))-methyltransferase [Bacillota bacterium Meth-B3]|nr:16S rRNA (uracil(1498)-N(3))-methyltransferase [Christensenellaceae bacterium]MEA5069523.1 16S rRNA (uracil(1498)-N(3))-methyltransferase [Christensenellaceae bacterium]